MSIYCISDIHGCYDEFMAVLDKAQFNSEKDILYVLGDVVDRGSHHVDCLGFIMNTKNVHMIMGNHEKMMLDFLAGNDKHNDWYYNGGRFTESELKQLANEERDEILTYIKSLPYYKTIRVGDRKYFLSHAGLNPEVSFKHQELDTLVWSREEFYLKKALPEYICIFGHTQTYYILNGFCSVWFDTKYADKVDIDCGCAYGGAMALLRLDDGTIFYEKSKRGNFYRYNLVESQAPSGFFG